MTSRRTAIVSDASYVGPTSPACSLAGATTSSSATRRTGRLGQLDELARPRLRFLDGGSRVAPGQFVASAGGWA